jgi:hypothetical protein
VIYRSIRLGAALCVALGVLGCTAGVASADQYIVDHCANWDTGAAGVAFGTVTGATADTCAAAGGALRVQVASHNIANNSSVGITLAVPADRPNVQIERAQTDWEVPTPTTAYVYMPMYDEGGRMVYNGQPPARPTLDIPFASANRALYWRVFCGGSDPVCGFAADYIINVYRTRLYLNEHVAPSLSINGGALLGTGAKSGRLSVLFDGADTDSGVASASIALGSTVVGGVEYACPHQDWSACPRNEANSALQADTTKVPDGTHEVFVTLRDAANNATTRSLGTIAVANAGGTGAPNGRTASRLAKLTTRYTTTKARSRPLRYGSRPSVRGTLLDEHGQPIAAATVAVLQRRRQAGAQSVQTATVTTSPDGRFAYKLDPGPSRTLTFAYTAFSGDAKPAATSALRTLVRASLTATITPRSPKAGALATISGRLRYLPRAGVLIFIQYHKARKWVPVGIVKTTTGGGFRWRHRFIPQVVGRTFTLRAKADSPIYPFAPGTSKPFRVHVR